MAAANGPARSSTVSQLPASLAYALGLATSPPPTGATPPHELRRLPELEHVVMLAGPGVLAANAVEGLRAFATAANLGVANTWGAKGVFRWDSPHHLGTGGLQRDDLALLGLDDADLVITSGLDADETPPEQLRDATCIDVLPQDLATLAKQVEPVAGPITETELYRRVSVIAGPGYVDDRFPRHPAAAVAQLRGEHGGSIVIAEPGFVGLWVARTFPTETPGSVVVPARGEPGVAHRLATTAVGRGRSVVVVTDRPAVDVPCPVVRWGADIDRAPTDDLVEAAGPVLGINGARLRTMPADGT